MKKEELWEIYVTKNPKFATEGANLTANGLKKLFEQVWEHAYKSGVSSGVASVNYLDKTKQTDGHRKFASILDDVFKR